jgi:glycosyltransferase involved in cell wall biosynthesis
VRILRVYHGGRNHAQRARERALAALGNEVTLVVPADWPEAGSDAVVDETSVAIVELPVKRAGDVNRHAYRDRSALARVLRDVQPDAIDIHEEPFSVAARQWLSVTPRASPVIMYTAQNVDKRFPPPFYGYELDAYRRIGGLYPCSRQAAAVARGKGFDGAISVIPLGIDPRTFRPGNQSVLDDELVFGIFGRLVPEKGVVDAVHAFAHVARLRPARLRIVGEGPEAGAVQLISREHGIEDRVDLIPWLPADEIAALYSTTHVVLVPSMPTATWAEQFGRVVVEAQASGAVVAGYASGAIPEVAADAGVLTTVGDVGGLSRKLEELISDAQLYETRRAAGLGLAEHRTWDRVAAQQIELVERVRDGGRRPCMPQSRGARRDAARQEFGPTALTTAGVRPFALPLLRNGGGVARALARVVDSGASTRARLAARRTRHQNSSSSSRHERHR